MSDESALDEREVSLIRWRCRRGLVENDLFLERFFTTYGAQLNASQARGLSQLMELPDNDLLDLFLRRTEPAADMDTPEVRTVLAQLRKRPHGAASA
ncbi:MAG: succinate dehydrogenase assembly factor 2 [Comamonadaceae bacterium]|nr:succinate dehydrogenase assembly factor 2 [Burkholderiales bacterium]MEB2349385.1 succinate dehydrogenase assembly factor 2 [Comamonadaceae bacterium]